jgi:hypothetical protein
VRRQRNRILLAVLFVPVHVAFNEPRAKVSASMDTTRGDTGNEAERTDTGDEDADCRNGPACRGLGSTAGLRIEAAVFGDGAGTVCVVAADHFGGRAAGGLIAAGGSGASAATSAFLVA